MRFKTRSTFVFAAAAALVISSAGFAAADNVVADGDNVEPVANNTLSLGIICVEDSVTENALVAVSRNGNYGNPTVFKAGSNVNMTVVGVVGSGLSAVMDPSPATITLDAGWDEADNNTMSDAVGSKITFVAGAAPTSFSGTVNYLATGVRDNGATITRDGSLSVTATVSNTGDCAPTPTDETAPVITSDVTGTLGNNGWYTSDVTVSWSVVDNESAVSSTDGCETETVTADTEGVTFTCSASSAGGTSSESVIIKRDATAPEVSLVDGPQDGAEYWVGSVPAAPTCSASDATSGLAGNCSDPAGYSTAVGTHTVKTSATDNAGNQANASATYKVKAWTLDGFFRPVDMGGKVNSVKGGSTVPLKFTLAKDVPVTELEPGSYTFRVYPMECGGVVSASYDEIDEYSTGKTALRYDADAGQWIQNWATPKVNKNTCYNVVFSAGGSESEAFFEVRK